MLPAQMTTTTTKDRSSLTILIIIDKNPKTFQRISLASFSQCAARDKMNIAPTFKYARMIFLFRRIASSACCYNVISPPCQPPFLAPHRCVSGALLGRICSLSMARHQDREHAGIHREPGTGSGYFWLKDGKDTGRCASQKRWIRSLQYIQTAEGCCAIVICLTSLT